MCSARVCGKNKIYYYYLRSVSICGMQIYCTLYMLYKARFGALVCLGRWPDMAPKGSKRQSWLVEKLQVYESEGKSLDKPADKERSWGLGFRV